MARSLDLAAARPSSLATRRSRWLALPILVVATEAAAAVIPAELVTRETDVPLGAVEAVASVNAPFTLVDGTVAFTGTLASGDAYVFIGDEVVWVGSNAMMSTLTGAESAMGATVLGGFAYAPLVDGSEAIWTHNGLLAVEGAQAALMPAGTTYTFNSRPSMSPDGAVYWVAGLNSSGGATTEGRVLYRSPTAMPGDEEVVLATGDMVAGLVIDTPAGIDVDYQVSANGMHLVAVLFMDTGSTINDGHVYLDGALLHQENTPNGTGDDWDNFDLVTVNGAGSYAVSGDTNGSTLTDEFIAMNGSIAIREGDVLDGVPLSSTAQVRLISLAEDGRLAHAWSYNAGGATTESVFYACNPADVGGSSRVVLTTGVDELDFDGDGVGDGLVADLLTANSSGSEVLSDDGHVHLEVQLDVGGMLLDAVVRVAVSCCGNGVVDTGEMCDDGNGDDGDDCPSTCEDAFCGDGFLWVGMEDCDDGNPANTDACLTSCVPASCGDGFLWAGVEECDDGNGDDSDECPGSCTVASCGDGFTWAGVEECDDANADDTDACLSTCVAASCGDGFVQVGVEECDDADGDDGDECPGNCLVASCGDGFVQVGVEECDDGNTEDGDGCDSDCTAGMASGSGGSSSGGDDESTGSSDGGMGSTSTSTSSGSSGGLDESGGSSGGGGSTGAITGGSTSPSTSPGDASSGDTGPGPFPGLDDDGGCSCRSDGGGGRGRAGLALLLLVALRRRSGRRARAKA